MGGNESPHDVPPAALLGLAAIVLALLAGVTGMKWIRENASSKARDARKRSLTTTDSDSNLIAGAGAGGEVKKAKRSPKVYQEYRIEDVRLHCSVKDAWVAIGNGVYDVTKWAPHHPGGERNIVDISGR